VRLVSDKADLETSLTEQQRSLKDVTAERDDFCAQLDAEKVSLSAKLMHLFRTVACIFACLLCNLVW